MFNDFIEVNPRKLGGTPVFRKTRIPVWILFEYLEEGYSVDAFLDQYEIDPDLVHGFLGLSETLFHRIRGLRSDAESVRYGSGQ
jgi:uncharacterized protein (DUF433 family)